MSAKYQYLLTINMKPKNRIDISHRKRQNIHDISYNKNTFVKHAANYPETKFNALSRYIHPSHFAHFLGLPASLHHVPLSSI